MKDILRKFYCFVVLCAYVVGAIGGVAYSIIAKEWFIAVCVAAMAAMAFPYARDRFKELRLS